MFLLFPVFKFRLVKHKTRFEQLASILYPWFSVYNYFSLLGSFLYIVFQVLHFCLSSVDQLKFILLTSRIFSEFLYNYFLVCPFTLYIVSHLLVVLCYTSFLRFNHITISTLFLFPYIFSSSYYFYHFFQPIYWYFASFVYTVKKYVRSFRPLLSALTISFKVSACI